MTNQTFIKQKIINSEELKEAFQRLLRNEVNLIYAENVKCSQEEFRNFNMILTQIKNMSWMFNISVKLERLGGGIYLEVKKKKGCVMNKYEKITRLRNFRTIGQVEDNYDIDDSLPEFLNINNDLYKLKKEEVKDDIKD